MKARGLAVLAAISLATMAVTACGATDSEATPTATVQPGVEGRYNTPATLRSYRFTVELMAAAELIDTSQAPPGLDLDDAVLTVSIEGQRVNPDREYSRSVTTFGYLSVERETIVIGGRLWSRQANNAWREQATLNDPEDFLGQEEGLTPAVILGTDDPVYLQTLTDLLADVPASDALVDGRPTRHVVFPPEVVEWMLDRTNTIPGLLRPDTLRIEAWPDVETGVALRSIVVGGTAEHPEAFRLVVELFDVNDPEIMVMEPEGALGP